MPAVNWDAFELLPGSVETNFEMLCRALIRRHYAKYGDFAALAAQPGVEFHLKVHTPCALGGPDRWYGWQCRWYDLPRARAIGASRRRKIEKAISTTHGELPDLTDWVLWTRHPLTKRDQKWFYALSTRMRLHLWTRAEVEEHLSGDAEILRATYFGELVLTPDTLARLHDVALAPIRRRWQPEVHQAVDAERGLRRILGESEAWGYVQKLATQLEADAAAVRFDLADLAGSLADTTKELGALTQSFALALADTHKSLERGDLDLLRQQLANRPLPPSATLAGLPRQLRSGRHRAALSVTNALTDIRSARVLQDDIDRQLGTRLIAVIADAGCGKTQCAAQLTASIPNRPAGILLLGRDLHAGHTLDDLAHHAVIQGSPVPSMEALVAAVDAAGQRAHRRVPIVIDGLNEAEDAREWKPLLASLNEVLRPYPYVLVVCTVRKAFADEALQKEIDRLEMPGFGKDTIRAIWRYFEHYRINAADAELPIGLLGHPLTLRLFCEVTNPKRERTVGIEAMPQSLTALFDRYLQKAAERIAELAPRTRRYYDHDVRAALDEIGIALWEAKARNLDQAGLRLRLNDAGRPWNESIVRALEQEGVLLRDPGEPPQGPRVAGVYDELAGHLIASAILAKHGRAAFERWLKDSATATAFNGSVPERHPLAADTFRALVGLVPRRLLAQQLWTFLDPPLRTTALRLAANLEGTYLDAATVRELSRLTLEMSTDGRDLFDRLWQTRGAPNHPLNAGFLHAILRQLSVANRDLRWTEWVRHREEELREDLRKLEERWRSHQSQQPSPERLRARWIMWTLTSTVRELRDRATRALYWFGRRDPAGLFRLTLDALAINDPYVSERMLVAAYGVCMALHCRPKRPLFRAKLLPAFAKRIYTRMFAPSAAHSTTHALSREYARRIIEVARLHSPVLLSKSEASRVTPPFKDGGIRNWEVLQDPNEGKYHEGNSPLGTDFANYTIGGLVPDRGNYDFGHKEYKRVVGQIIWRFYQLGYSLDAFGEIDKQIARGSYFGRAERPQIERYGKKYARIAYFELYGFRKDAGLLNSKWYTREDRPSAIDIDPSFPHDPRKMRLIEDFLGDRSGDLSIWVHEGPTPDFGRYLVQTKIDGVIGPWMLLDGHCRQHDKPAERLAYVVLQSFLLLKDDVQEFIRLMKKESPRGKWLPEEEEDDSAFAGEIPWCNIFPHNVLSTVDFIIGTATKKVPPNDPRYNLRIIFDLGRESIGPKEAPKFERVNLYRKIPVYVPVRRSNFSSRASCVVPSKEIAQSFQLWLNLPTWEMYDQSGRVCSIATAEGGFPCYESYLFFRKELIESLLASQKLALVWVVWGERQHFGERHVMTDAPSLGYKYFHRVYRYTSGQPKRVI